MELDDGLMDGWMDQWMDQWMDLHRLQLFSIENMYIVLPYIKNI